METVPAPTFRSKRHETQYTLKAMWADPATRLKMTITPDNPAEAVRAFVVGELERRVYGPRKAMAKAARDAARAERSAVRDAVRVGRLEQRSQERIALRNARQKGKDLMREANQKAQVLQTTARVALVAAQQQMAEVNRQVLELFTVARATAKALIEEARQ